MNAEMDLVDFAVDHARTKGATYAEARFEKQEPENFILKNGVLDALYVGMTRASASGSSRTAPSASRRRTR